VSAVAGAGIAASAVSAYIQHIELPYPPVVFAFNPEEYTVTKSAEWHATPQAGAASSAKPQFKGSKAHSMTIRILLDAFGVPPVPPRVNIMILEAALVPSPVSFATNEPKPPLVMFGWGTNIVMEQAYVKSMSVAYKRFLLGEPVRAEVSLTLNSVPIPIPGTNPTSGGITARRTHTVIEGDTLASIAYEEFRDPTKWRALAELNGIDDPMRIPAGTVLLVPAPGEADALA
jgi:nucleoid-associated protein YgaU